SHPMLLHHHELRAIRQRPLLVWSSMVKVQTAPKDLAAGLDHLDQPVGSQVVDEGLDSRTHHRSSKGVSHLYKHPFGRNHRAAKRSRKGGGFRMRSVAPVQ